MDDSTTRQPLMPDTADGTEAALTPQDTMHESDAEETAGHAKIAAAANVKAIQLKLSSTWYIEIITMCISFACMAALVYILIRFQNRLSTEWSFFISFNAVIAIAITAAKATLLAAISVCLSQEKWIHFNNKNKTHCLQDLAIIDIASRGPLGSLQMLYKVSWGFASISAIVTILSLPTDTFIQQVVQQEPGTLHIYQEGSATFGHAYGYRTKASRQFRYEMRKHDDIPNAVFRGLYQDSWPFEFNCTSNCTWDEHYLTLGFISTCANVTEEAIETVKCEGYQIENTEYPESGTPCSMTTPKGVQFNIILEEGFFMGINSSIPKSPYLNGSDLFEVAVWTWDNYFDENYFENPIDFRTRLQASVVVECALGIALYNYSDISSISNNFNIGATETVLLGESTGHTLETYSIDTIPPTETEVAEVILWWNHTDKGLLNIHLSETDLNYAGMFFHSTAFSGTVGDRDSYDSSSPGATIAFGNGSLEVVSGVFDGIALSLTDLVRQGSAMQLAQGKTSQAVVYIRVRWRWLILPLVVHFLGGIALFGTIIGRKRTRDVPLWKGSALAVLYHSVDQDGLLVPQLKDLKELEKVERIQVMLENKSDISK